MNRDNFSESHIRALQLSSKRDPGLIERTVFAFGLLDALCLMSTASLATR